MLEKYDPRERAALSLTVVIDALSASGVDEKTLGEVLLAAGVNRLAAAYGPAVTAGLLQHQVARLCQPMRRIV